MAISGQPRRQRERECLRSPVLGLRFRESAPPVVTFLRSVFRPDLWTSLVPRSGEGRQAEAAREEHGRRDEEKKDAADEIE